MSEIPNEERFRCCPLCGSAIDIIYTNSDLSIQWDGKVWAKHTDRPAVFRCSNCMEELDDRDLDILGVPNELR